MADGATPTTPATDQGSAALGDIATNGALLNQTISQLTQAVSSLQNITMPAINGGTGNASYAVGDILSADTTTTLSRIADIATGNALLSGGVNTLPSWGKVSLTTTVTGALPVANGGTGDATLTAYAVLCGGTTSTAAVQSVAGLGSSNQVLMSNGASALPTFQGGPAAASDYQGNTSNLLFISPNTVWNAAADVALTDAASIAVDMSTGFNFTVTIAGNRTIANPSNAKPGQSGVFKVTADSSNRTIAVGTNYKKTAGISFPLTVTATQTCYIYYNVDTSSRIIVTSALNNPT